MSAKAGRVLVVDDDRAMCAVLCEGLTLRSFDVKAVLAGSPALQLLGAEDYDVVLTDLHMREMGGIELCEKIREVRPGLPVVVLTAFGSLETAVAAIRAGAYDFVTKPADLDMVELALARAVQHRRLNEELRLLREGAVRADRYEELLGDSAAMRRVYGMLERIADTDVTVLISGESGTGKELVARALHRRSRRRDAPFVAVNCAALPEQLLESELFGHVRGAFTDARQARTGLFLTASGGTLFFDEVAEVPPPMQVKLLRALQERRVRPIGGDAEVPIDVRIVAATNRDLESDVEEGRFREDFYFRLNVVPIHLPPLRARGRDVLTLAQHFLQRAAQAHQRPVKGLSPEVAEKLLAYPWPGNVRELQNCIEHAVALARTETIAPADLPRRLLDHRPSQLVLAGDDPDALVPLEEMERRYVLRVLEAVGGHRATAAQILGVDRKTLYRKLQRWRG